MLPTQNLHFGHETIFVKTSVDPVILVISNQLSRFLKTFRPAPLVTVLLCSRTNMVFITVYVTKYLI